MNQLIEELKPDYEKTIEHLKKELAGLRTGRATVSLVEGILVDSYGSKMPLKQLASISVPDPKTIVVQAWDKNLTVEVEKAISQAGKGFSIVMEGDFVRLSLPSLSEETRKNITKILHEKLEGSRIAIREIRDKTRDSITKMFREKEVTEDDKYILYEDLNKMTTEYNDKIKEIGDIKEKEIMTV